MVVPQKIIIELSYSLGICPKEMKAGTQNRYCTPMFITALFTEAQRWKQPVSINGWMNKSNMVYTYADILLYNYILLYKAEYYSALKRKTINIWIWIGHM